MYYRQFAGLVNYIYIIDVDELLGKGGLHEDADHADQLAKHACQKFYYKSCVVSRKTFILIFISLF